MAGLLSSSSSHLILHHISRPPAPTRPSSSSFLSFFLFKPFTAIRLPTTPLRSFSSSTSHSSRPLVFPSLALSLSSSLPPPHPLPNSLSNSQQTLEPEIQDACEGTHDEEVETGDEDFESDVEEMVSESTERALNSSLSTRGKESASELPSLTVKEKKELASYAHSLGKKLKSQQVGKSGVTDSVAAALIETLEANELLKLKIHGSCPGELEDVVKQLEEATGSVVVGQIGRTVILYRPSLTKLKAEEKKKQAQRVFRRKQPTLKPSFENKGQAPEPSGRGRRGSSRFFRSP